MAAQKGLAKNKLRVRMYRVGFGDCFLVSVPEGDGHKHILVDCGVHFRGDIKVMEDVIRNIGAETDWKLAIVIASHAHQDHISGFGAYAELWKQFTIGEVWLPWLEDPKNRQAKKLRQKRAALASSLRSHFAAAPGAVNDQITDLLVNATGMTLDGRAAAGGTNAAAMNLLMNGFDDQAEVRYLEAGEELRHAGRIKGLTARILAPSTDEKFLSRMDPPPSQRFLRLGPDGVAEEGKLEPFAPRWCMSAAPPGFEPLSEEEAKELGDQLTVPMDRFALALDRVLNNTSLVVAFRFGGELLLFPGDAQWGNWQSWIAEGKDLLNEMTFYKVGHHGSHNATPKEAVEHMPENGFVAMASTQSKPWDSIPAPKLVKALKQRSGNQYIQSDSIRVISKLEGREIPFEPVRRVPSKFVRGALWYDYVR